MKKAIITLLFFIVLIAIIPVLLPKTIHEEVEYVYDDTPDKVYDYFNNLKKMSLWIDWGKSVNVADRKFSSVLQGVGAEYSWGNEKGKLNSEITITDGKDLQFVGYKIKFNNYDGNTSEAIFQTLDDGKVKVIWTFDSASFSYPYPYQIYNYIMGFGVKKDLERSLIRLDNLLIKEKKKESITDKKEVSVVDLNEKNLFGIVQSVDIGDKDEYNTALEESFGTVESYLLDEKHINPSKISNDVVYLVKNGGKENTFIIGFFVDTPVDNHEDMQNIKIGKGKYLTINILNNSSAIDEGYNTLYNYAIRNHLNFSKENRYRIIDGNNTQLYVPLLD